MRTAAERSHETRLLVGRQDADVALGHGWAPVLLGCASRQTVMPTNLRARATRHALERSKAGAGGGVCRVRRNTLVHVNLEGNSFTADGATKLAEELSQQGSGRRCVRLSARRFTSGCAVGVMRVRGQTRGCQSRALTQGVGLLGTQCWRCLTWRSTRWARRAGRHWPPC